MDLVKENIHQRYKVRNILKKIIFLSLIFVLLIPVGCSDMTDAEKLEKYKYHISQSESLVDNRQFSIAISHTDSAISITDTLSAAFYVRGAAYFGQGKYKAAKEDFTEVIDIDGEKSKAYKYRALSYLKLNDSDFLDDIEQYLKNYPSDEYARNQRIDYYVAHKEYNKAIKDYEFLLSRDKGNLNLQKKLSDLRYKNGDLSEALSHYDNILKTSPQDAEVLKKKQELENQIKQNDNRNNFIYCLVGSYFSYLIFVAVIIRPVVKRKARKYIGGTFEIAKDPLIWWLPVILLSVFLYFYYFNQLPIINFF